MWILSSSWCLLWPAHMFYSVIVLCLKTRLVQLQSVVNPALWNVCLNCFTEAFSVCTDLNALTSLVCVLSDSVRLSGEEGWFIKGMDKGSFDDVTSFILRRHQKNLCLSLLKIYGPSSSSSTSSSSPSASSQREVCFSTNPHMDPVCMSISCWSNGFFIGVWFLPWNAKLLHCLIFRGGYYL